MMNRKFKNLIFESVQDGFERYEALNSGVPNKVATKLCGRHIRSAYIDNPQVTNEIFFKLDQFGRLKRDHEGPMTFLAEMYPEHLK